MHQNVYFIKYIHYLFKLQEKIEAFKMSKFVDSHSEISYQFFKCTCEMLVRYSCLMCALESVTCFKMCIASLIRRLYIRLFQRGAQWERFFFFLVYIKLELWRCGYWDKCRGLDYIVIVIVISLQLFMWLCTKKIVLKLFK